MKVDDAATFVIRPNMAVKLAGIQAPRWGRRNPVGKRRAREWDRLGRSIAHVKIDGVDVNRVMAEFLENLKSESP